MERRPGFLWLGEDAEYYAAPPPASTTTATEAEAAKLGVTPGLMPGVGDRPR